MPKKESATYKELIEAAASHDPEFLDWNTIYAEETTELIYRVFYKPKSAVTNDIQDCKKKKLSAAKQY